MEKQSFNTMTVISGIGLVLAAAVILFACVVPRAIVVSLYYENKALISGSISAATEGDNETVRKNAEIIAEHLDEKKDLLMFFYDHNSVTALTGAAHTAIRLSETDEKAQLTAELREIEKAFERLMLTDEISLKSIF